jgi:hypothetical protein
LGLFAAFSRRAVLVRTTAAWDRRAGLAQGEAQGGARAQDAHRGQEEQMRKFRVGVAALVVAVAGLVGVDPAGAAATTQVVHAQTVGGWFSLNEGPGGSVGTANFVQGPGSLPAGSGSVQLTVDSAGRASIGTGQFAGLRLDQLTELSYWAYVPSAAGNYYPVVQFDVDYNLNDGNTGYQGRLSYNLPAPLALGTWTKVNATTPGGTFFRSNTAASNALACGSACTIPQILAAYPNAGIRNASGAPGALLIRLGGPISGGAVVYADAVTVATSANSVLTDFEPGATLSPTNGPAGTVVTASGYGFKPGKKITMKYRTYAKPKWLKFCAVKANLAGTASCSFTVPASGNVGVHAVSIKGRGPTAMIEYLPEFFRTP